jgi:hypothetical protein
VTRIHFLVIGAISTSVALTAAQTQPAPILEVDHVFILTAPTAKEERAAVEAAGFAIGSHVAKHAGAGTASVGVLFANAYLELLWLDPTVSVDPDQMKDVDLMRRRAAGARAASARSASRSCSSSTRPITASS